MRKFIYVSGQCDFSALEMEESGELKELAKEMIIHNQKQIESEDGSIVILYEFGEVDDKFLDFMFTELLDYDSLKCSCLYKLEDLLENKYL